MDTTHEKALALVDSLINDLLRFEKLKDERWVALESSFQMSNKLGVPSEDWIIPPDEKKVEDILLEDEDYSSLRATILNKTEKVKAASNELHFDTHHKLDWLKFTDPLIGTEALRDALASLRQFADFLQKH